MKTLTPEAYSKLILAFREHTLTTLGEFSNRHDLGAIDIHGLADLLSTFDDLHSQVLNLAFDVQCGENEGQSELTDKVKPFPFSLRRRTMRSLPIMNTVMALAACLSFTAFLSKDLFRNIHATDGVLTVQDASPYERSADGTVRLRDF